MEGGGEGGGGGGGGERGTADFRDARTTRANSRRSELLRPSRC